jgi:hypothetical protein
MPLTPKQRHKLLMADRTRDAAWIAVVIEDLLAANPDTTLPEIDYELRSAAAQAYLVAIPGTAAGFKVVLGELAFRRRVSAAGMTGEQNRAALARKPVAPT